jgi:hypothetical protein
MYFDTESATYVAYMTSVFNSRLREIGYMFAERKTNEKLEFTTFCHLILKNVFQWFIHELPLDTNVECSLY